MHSRRGRGASRGRPSKAGTDVGPFERSRYTGADRQKSSGNGHFRLDLARAASYMTAMALPKMVRVRQRFARPVVSDIPAATRATLAACGHPIRGGDVVAIGTSSRGIDHYGINEKTMGVPCRATMEVVQVGEALGLPVWLEKGAAGADWVCLVNRIKPHTDFKGSIESGLFKMMTIGLGKYKGAVQYHRANVRHSYETVITGVGREMLAKARIAFGLGIVENGYDETAHVEAFGAADLEAGERRLLKMAKENLARLPLSALEVLIVEQVGKNVSGAGMDTNVIGRPSNPHEPFPNDPRILWIVALDLTDNTYGNATGIGNADFTTRKLVEKIDMKATLINCLAACSPGGAKLPPAFDSDREAIEAALSCTGLLVPEREAR